MIFITARMGPMIGAPMTVLSVFFMVFMNMLELLVAYIQAYVFTMLSSVFIGLAHPEPEHAKGKKEIEEKVNNEISTI